MNFEISIYLEQKWTDSQGQKLTYISKKINLRIKIAKISCIPGIGFCRVENFDPERKSGKVGADPTRRNFSIKT